MARVVITDCDHGTTACEEEVLRQAGHEVTAVSARSEEEVMAPAREAEALIVQYAQITSRSSLPWSAAA